MFVREERSSPSTGILKPIDDANESNTRISRNKRCRCHDRCNYDNGYRSLLQYPIWHIHQRSFIFSSTLNGINCLLTVFAGSTISSLLLIAPPPNASALPAMADAIIAASAAGCSSVVSTIILLSNICFVFVFCRCFGWFCICWFCFVKDTRTNQWAGTEQNISFASSATRRPERHRHFPSIVRWSLNWLWYGTCY